jgi:hypothetical protein
MLDKSGKLMTPVISVKRNSMTERDTLQQLAVNWVPTGDNEYARNTLLHENKFSRGNQYDRFSILQNSRPKRELYVSSVPIYVDVTYDIMLWTQLNEQLNSLVEQIMPTNGVAWGTTWKFPAIISDYSFEVVNAPGEERVVQATLPMTVKASILNPFELRRSSIYKQFSIKRIAFGNETESFNVNITDPPPNGY